MEQMFRTQSSHQCVLHEVVGRFDIAGQRARIAPQSRNGRLHLLSKLSQATHLCVSLRPVVPGLAKPYAFNNTMGRSLFLKRNHALTRRKLGGPKLDGPKALCHRRPGLEIARQGSEQCRKSRASCAANVASLWGWRTIVRSPGALPKPAVGTAP